MSLKLSTGRTARQELIFWVRNAGGIKDWPVADLLEYQFRDLRYSDPDSLIRVLSNYWDSLSSEGQARLFATMKRLVIADDRLRFVKFNR